MSVALLSRATVVAFGFKSHLSSSTLFRSRPQTSMSSNDASRGRRQGAIRGEREGPDGGACRAEPHAVLSYESPFFTSDQQLQAQTALIVLNTPFQTLCSSREDGEEDLPAVLRALWKASSYRVCADGGANRLFDAVESARRRHGTDDDDHSEWTPDVVTGDLDSIRPEVRQFYENKGVSIVHVEDQDFHDLDKSLMAVERWFAKSASNQSRLFIYGGFGGRFDQEMACINALLAWGNKDTFRQTLFASYNEETCAFLLRESPVVNQIRIMFPDDSLVYRTDDSVGVMVGEGPTCGLVPIFGRCETVTTSGLKWNLDGDTSEFGGLVSTSNRVMDEVVSVGSSHPLIFTAEIVRKSCT
mmetsp:Transcript_34252/g.81948  ORF Transcript_34252/g.81948 Transcript_34252/m.81948 type:complete len:358 (+) Transcript_34252:186-1259(+)